MIPTPDLSHLTKDDLRRVYDPAEDTFLLLDALEQDATFLQELKPTVCVEVGSGSGCVSAFLGSILKDVGSLIISTDINHYASKCTAGTGSKNSVRIDPVVCDLVAPLLPRLFHHVDVLIFNPPYVPTEEEEALNAQAQGDIAGAWAGGFDGMAITNRLLDNLGNILSPRGYLYLVALKQNDPSAIIRRMEGRWEMVGEIILERRAGREHLFIIRFARV
ncbi:S-adenosyl-L-methionine-dependent methyltransferase [Ceratobasidium sp. AG-I]|nr:S-adenosyl-L-methionine-dependent methyltransferase [Ceratobasidium sp. AG-I]